MKIKNKYGEKMYCVRQVTFLLFSECEINFNPHENLQHTKDPSWAIFYICGGLIPPPL